MLRQTHVGSSRRFAHLSLRLLLLLIGMFTAALGVALTTVADLGTTPISTVPYVFTVLTGYSFGTTTFFVNLFLVAGQVLLLRRRFSLWNLLQIPTVLIFGICIDLAMAIVSPHAPAGSLKSSKAPTNYFTPNILRKSWSRLVVSVVHLDALAFPVAAT